MDRRTTEICRKLRHVLEMEKAKETYDLFPPLKIGKDPKGARESILNTVHNLDLEHET